MANLKTQRSRQSPSYLGRRNFHIWAWHPEAAGIRSPRLRVAHHKRIFKTPDSKLINACSSDCQDDENKSNLHAGPCWPSRGFSSAITHKWWTTVVEEAFNSSGNLLSFSTTICFLTIHPSFDKLLVKLLSR